LLFCHQNPQYGQLINQHKDDENALSIIFVTFVPTLKQSTLEWNPSLVEKCFQRSLSAIKAYINDPENTLLAILG